MNPRSIPTVAFVTVRTWFDVAPDAMIAVDKDGRIILANAQAEHMFGYETAALDGLSLEALLPESLRRAHRKHRQEYTTEPRLRPMGIGYELLGLRNDGQSFPVEIGLSPVATEQGVVTLASLRDISDTRRVRRERERTRRDAYAASMSQLALESPDRELAIRRILELAATALELPAVAILSSRWHGGGLHVRASSGLADPIAQTLVSVLGADDFFRDTFGDGEHKVVTATMARAGVLQTLRTELADAGYHDFAITSLAGSHEPPSLLVALATASASFDKDKASFLQSAAYRLASAMQRSRLEDQLAHAQRLDAVGQLTGGIAHDFNNLLTVVSGNLQLLEAELAARPDLREIVDSAMRAVDRGSGLTRRLLAFARRQPLQPRAVVPKPLLDELGHVLRRTLGEAIRIQIDCAADVPDVYADPNELDTALVNLALNARDAMPRGGELRIGAHAITLDDLDNPHKLPSGCYVMLEVSDTGTGMPPEVQAHVFEPFFTTKESAKGSGLGLSMVYGFATQSGGSIAIDSRLGYGTRVELVLPAVSADAATTRDPQAEADVRTGGRAKILVVEDEADVRTIASRFLGAVGYHVVAAASAREGLDLLIADPSVDLLFSDVVLGSGMDGIELAQEARRIRPQLPILLTSGYAGPENNRSDDAAVGIFEMLRKPYRREQLLDAIQRLLDDA